MNAIPEPNAHVTPTNTYSFTDESLAAHDARVRAEALAAIEARLEAEIRPLIAVDKYSGGYDCCGCSTYDAILDHAIRIARGE